MEVVEWVLAGEVQQDIVGLIHQAGGRAKAKTVVVVLHALQQPFSRHVHLFGGGADPAGKVGLELLLRVARDVAEGFAIKDKIILTLAHYQIGKFHVFKEL